ncbi:MAG TPA: hypothetical protein ENL35_11315 [Chloroflexi bacterium]|nr:hypothetical protein [Chloroflexota bacterium]
MSVPAGALFGAQTRRVVENFLVSGIRPWRAFIPLAFQSPVPASVALRRLPRSGRDHPPSPPTRRSLCWKRSSASTERTRPAAARAKTHSSFKPFNASPP